MKKDGFKKIAFLLCLVFAGLGEIFAQQAAAPKPPVEENSYLVAPDDVVDIKVFQEDDLASTLRVSKDGTITFPLVGKIKVAGMGPHDAAKAIRDALAKDYLVNPQVTLTVTDYAKRRFTVLGQVQKPGSYEMPDRDKLGLLEAIGMAGGYTRIADPSKIVVKRQVNGQETLYKLNAKRMAGTQDPGDFQVMQGDIISVAESLF